MTTILKNIFCEIFRNMISPLSVVVDIYDCNLFGREDATEGERSN